MREALKVLGKFGISRIYDFLILRLRLCFLVFLIAIERFRDGIGDLLCFYLVVLVQVGKPSRQLRAVLVISQEISGMLVAKPFSESISIEDGGIL